MGLKNNKSSAPNLFAGELTILYIINMITCLFFVGFAIRNFYLGNHWFAIALTAYVVCSAITAHKLHSDRSRQYLITVCIMFLLFALLLMMRDWGITAVYWFFPVVIALVFILPTKTSLILNALITAGIGWLALDTLSFIEAFRLTMSLFLNITISYLIAAHMTKLHRTIEKESISDPLTGVLNRRQLDSHLISCNTAFNEQQIPSCILMIDIDHFKSINDSFGHNVGDQVIIGLTRLIQTYCRSQDSLFRVGGEEFVLLLPDTNQSDALKVANKIKHHLKSANLIEGRAITASIGIAETSEALDNAELWLKSADDCMYQAKAAGRDRICYF